MNENNFLNYITTSLSESSDRIKKVHTKVKHGRLKIQRKKVKSQVLKDSKPTDYKRLKICKDARKKAHSSVANTKRNISNEVRNNLKENLHQEWKPEKHSLKLSEAYGFDFVEEALGYGNLDVEFFDRPTTTAITEGLVVGKTRTGRDRKCKAIGIAEGVFAPITDAEGNRVFSRNNRLYEEDHWDYQLENQNLVDRIATRRMLGTIGHHDKRVDDDDLAEGKVSHIVTNLEIREDSENGRYVWGRLEIINTEAGRRLKEYYDNDIPLFVSSRGGGKLLDSGEGYKVVDKARYFCETFDVVKEPGYLEARPKYFKQEPSVLEELEALVKEIAEKTGLVVDEDAMETLKNTFSTVSESVHSDKIDEDNNMKNIDCNVHAGDDVEAILAKIVKPLAESMQELTKTVEKIQSDLYESEEASVEEVKSEVAEEVSEEAPEEQAPAEVEEPAQEEKVEEVVAEEVEATEEQAPAEEVSEEAPEAAVEAPAEEVAAEETVEEVVAEEKEDKKEKEEKEEPSKEVEECNGEETTEEATEEVTEKCEKCGEEECKCEKEDKEEKEEPVKEEWAKEDPKETVSKIAEMPSGDAPEKTELEKKLEAEIHAEEAKDLKAAAIKEEAEEATEEQAPAGMEEVTDYKKMYEGLQAEVDEAVNEVNKMVETFKDFGKKYTEVVTEKDENIAKLTEQLETANKELNSYKLSEKFNVTVEEANEMLGSKSYEAVEEELKEAEATKLQEEAQAKVEQVSESIQSDVETIEAPVSKKRKAYSAFSAQPEEKISEELEIKPSRKAFSWFN